MKTLHRLLLFTLCVSAANLLSAAPATDIPQRHRLSPTAVRVVSANIRYLTPADKKTGDDWDARKELARDSLQAQDADIICFQEFNKEHLDYLIKYFPDFVAVGFVDAPNERKVNTIFFSTKRFEKIKMDGAFLSPTPEVFGSKFAESSGVRQYTRLHLKDRKTGGELMVWNTHFDHRNQAGRDVQGAALVEAIKKYPSSMPQFITGDFNCAAKTKAIQTILSGGFIDSYTAIHGPDDPGNTYHGFIGDKYSKKTGKIDFVFINKSFRPTAAEIIRDSRNGHYPSDHYFVSAELEYASPQPPLAIYYNNYNQK